MKINSYHYLELDEYEKNIKKTWKKLHNIKAEVH